MTDKIARRIAAAVTESSITVSSAMHDALRQAEIERNASLIGALAEAADLDLAAIERRMTAQERQAA